MNKLKIMVALNMIAKRTKDSEVLSLVDIIIDLLKDEEPEKPND